MKRRGILAALFAGTASAQVMRLLPFGDMVKVKPANGQCPTCGLVKLPVSDAPVVEGPRIHPMLVRCDFCSIAFFQDSE